MTPAAATPTASLVRRAVHGYDGCSAVLATMHHKLPLIAPSMLRALGLCVRSVHVDTDRFGTFTGDVERSMSPFDTAVAKARLAMASTGSTLGLASEGTIGTPSGLAWVTAATELVVLVDDARGIVVGEQVTSFDITTVAATVHVGECLDALLARADFPRHGLVVRPAVHGVGPIQKGIHDRRELERAVLECAAASPSRYVRIETDLRAHHCPSRRPIIAAAAERLAARLATPCPRCCAPGWGVVRVERGVPCRSCGTEVDVARADEHGCSACDAVEIVTRPDADAADPALCPWCNP